MREIDTEAPVEWPAWCYSANTQESAIDVISRKGDLASDLLPATSPSSYIQSSNTTTILPISVSLNKSRTRRKNHYTTSSSSSASTPTTAGHGKGGSASYDSSIASSASNTTSVPSISPLSHDIASVSEKLQQHLQLSSFLINKKMLSERILMGFGSSSASDSIINSSANNNNINNNNNNNNSSSNGKKNCDSSTFSVYDKIKNEPNMMDPITTVHVGSSSLKNGDLSVTNNGNSSSGSVTVTNLANTQIKKERLSPLANGDVQSSMSRSRSATPSSFPGTPPQSSSTASHANDLTTQHLLNQSRNNDFQSRNYSDFMRSLAAKYNNNNPNDSAAARNLFFDNQKHSNSSSNTTKLTNKSESPSPPEIKRPSLPTPPQVPFVPPLFPGLPFSTSVFPPLIDMSSTQALVTLARAAKEAELQNILRNVQKRPSTTSAGSSLSPSLRAVLNPTPQQLAQFNPQSFMLPAQFQPPSHRSPTTRSPRSSQSPHQYRGEPSSSTLTTASTSSSSNNVKRSSSPPLDLSSTQYSKRHKSGSNTSSPATSPPMSSTASNVIKSENSPKESRTFGSSTTITIKRTESPSGGAGPSSRLEFPRHCRAQSDEINSWSVDDVCNFVTGIDICAEYAQKFRDQCIDGSGLPLLTEEHLTNSLGMKLGPALKLRSILAKKLGGPCPCVSCTTLQQQQQQQQLMLQQQQHQQQQPPAVHLTPPHVGSTSTQISSSSSSTSSSSLSTTSTISGSLTTTVGPSAATTATNSHASNANNTANCTSARSSSPVVTNNTSAANNNNPIRPASADSGS